MTERSAPIRGLTLDDIDLDDSGRVVIVNEVAERAIKEALDPPDVVAHRPNTNCYGCNSVAGCGKRPESA